MQRVVRIVWVDEWQVQCCGDPFEEGQEVTWSLAAVRERFGIGRPTDAVGDDVARRITHVEDHHDVLSQGTSAVRGRVVSLLRASCRFAPRPGRGADRALHPVPGSAVLQKVTRAAGREAAAPGLRVIGYVVELRVAAPEP